LTQVMDGDLDLLIKALQSFKTEDE